MSHFSFTPEQAVEIIKKLAEAGVFSLSPLEMKKRRRISISLMPLSLMVFICNSYCQN